MNKFWNNVLKSIIPATVEKGIKRWQQQRIIDKHVAKLQKDIDIKEQRIEANELKNKKLELQNEKYELQIAQIKKKL